MKPLKLALYILGFVLILIGIGGGVYKTRHSDGVATIRLITIGIGILIIVCTDIIYRLRNRKAKEPMDAKHEQVKK